MKLNNINKPVRSVIFDCDGVLVDSEIIASQVSLRMLRPFGVHMEPKDYARKYAGKVEEDILDLISREYQIDLPDDFLPSLRLKIEYALDHELQPIKGAKETITTIQLPKAVVSNSRLSRVISSLKVADLAELFGKNLFAAEMVAKPKPAPDVYLYAASQLEIDPAHCLVVEDSLSGVTAAHSAGMQVIGFLAASHIPEGHDVAVKEAGAMATVKSMEELKQLLEDVL